LGGVAVSHALVRLGAGLEELALLGVPTTRTFSAMPSLIRCFAVVR
jgi:hypothetical protein